MSLTKEDVQGEILKGALVVNVLGENPFADLHIRGSVNVTLKGKSDDDFAAEINRRFGKERLVITHCSGLTCSAGPRAATILRGHGFKAEDYPGGIEDWKNAGLPVGGNKAHLQVVQP